MIKLTKHQLFDIQNLMDNPLIDQASIDFHGNGLLRVVIISKPNADQEKIDSVLEQIFPGMEYRGIPAYNYSGEINFIDWNGETLIHLLMKRNEG